MTPRERRYHQQKQLQRRLQHASHILACGLHRLIEASKPVPKYPLGGKGGPALIGAGEPEALPAYTIGIDASALQVPPEFFAPCKPVQVLAVDNKGMVHALSPSRLAEVLQHWNKDKDS